MSEHIFDLFENNIVPNEQYTPSGIVFDACAEFHEEDPCIRSCARLKITLILKRASNFSDFTRFGAF